MAYTSRAHGEIHPQPHSYNRLGPKYPLHFLVYCVKFSQNLVKKGKIGDIETILLALGYSRDHKKDLEKNSGRRKGKT